MDLESIGRAATLTTFLCTWINSAGAADVPVEVARAIAAGGNARIIVELSAGTPGERARRAAVESLADSLVLTTSRLVRSFQTVPLAALEVDARGLDVVRSRPDVVRVWPDRVYEPSLRESVAIVGADYATAVGLDGRGIVAVLDTGVDTAHPFFGGRVIEEACFSEGDCPNGQNQQFGPGAGVACTYADDCSHGTAVAGVVGARGNDLLGVAPAARLFSVRVSSLFSCGGNRCARVRASDQIAGLDHVLARRRQGLNVVAAVITFGDPGRKFAGFCDGEPLKPVIDGLRALGVPTMISTGNQGDKGRVREPGCISTAITIGATDDADQIGGFSNSSPTSGLPDLLAPGVDIITPVPGGGLKSFSGTSVAAPHAAGAFAVMRQRFPSSDPAEMEAIIARLRRAGPLLRDSNGLERSRLAIPPVFAGGVAVAGGDVDGDDSMEALAAAGPGGGPHVRCAFGCEQAAPRAGLMAFNPGFSGGTWVASCDVDGDDVADWVVGAGGGAGPHVRVFSGATLQGIRSFFPYPSGFRGGVRVACGNVDGERFGDIVTAAGPGGSPHVRVFDGETLADLGGFLAYHPGFPHGVYVAAGDVDGDGRAEIVTGAGERGAPHVRVFRMSPFDEVRGFYAYGAEFSGGVRVGTIDADGDGKADVVTGAGPGGGPHVRIFDGETLADLGGLFAYSPDFRGGVFVAGARIPTLGGPVVVTGPGAGLRALLRLFAPSGAVLGPPEGVVAFE